jgi:ABC-type amino acid transport system permease subunit
MIEFDFLAVLAEWPLLLKGLAWTLGLTLVATPLGLLIATGAAWAQGLRAGVAATRAGRVWSCCATRPSSCSCSSSSSACRQRA